MNVLIIVTEEVLLLLRGEGAKWLGENALGIFTTDHEADLARWVARDGGIGVLDIREDLLAVFLQLSD